MRVIKSDRYWLEKIAAIKAEHPLWGYRRVWAYLRYRQGLVVGKHRVYRIMKEHSLLVSKNMKLKAKRKVGRPKPVATGPNQYWGMDMTKLLFDEGWYYLHIVKDWHDKSLIGWHLSRMSRTDDWLTALNQAVNLRYPEGIGLASGKPALITDNGCQPTSARFMKACYHLGIKQIFTSFNNPKGNADTERLIRTIKEDLYWVREWRNGYEFEQAFGNWVDDYNNDFPHMALGYQTPQQFFNNTPLVAA